MFLTECRTWKDITLNILHKAQSEYFKQLCLKLQVGQQQHWGVCRFAAEWNGKIKWMWCVSLSDIFLSLIFCWPQNLQASCHRPSLWLSPRHSQLSCSWTSWSSTLCKDARYAHCDQGSLFTQHQEMFDNDIFKHTARWLEFTSGPSVCAGCDSQLFCYFHGTDFFSYSWHWFECFVKCSLHNQVIWWVVVFSFFLRRKSWHLRNDQERRGWKMTTKWVLFNESNSTFDAFCTNSVRVFHCCGTELNSTLWPPSDDGASLVPWAQSYTCFSTWAWAWAGHWYVDGKQWGVLLLWSESLRAGAHQCWGQVLPPELLHLPSVRHHTQTGRIHLWPDYRWGRSRGGTESFCNLQESLKSLHSSPKSNWRE